MGAPEVGGVLGVNLLRVREESRSWCGRLSWPVGISEAGLLCDDSAMVPEGKHSGDDKLAYG